MEEDTDGGGGRAAAAGCGGMVPGAAGILEDPESWVDGVVPGGALEIAPFVADSVGRGGNGCDRGALAVVGESLVKSACKSTLLGSEEVFMTGATGAVLAVGCCEPASPVPLDSPAPDLDRASKLVASVMGVGG